jgi:membrane fusion protein (multidrug efflux system)
MLAPVLFASLLLALSSCAKGGAGAGGFKMPPTPVEVSPVQSQTVRDQFHALGTIESENNVQITAEVTGVVRSLPFIEGQPVEQGAMIASLDDREAKAESDRAEAQRQLAAADYDRAQKLADKQLNSAQDLDNARANMKVAEANADLARVHLEKTHIRAPFEGVVGRRLTSVGAWLKPGDAVTDLARLSTLRVAFSAPERMLGELRPGRAVEVRTPAWPGRVFDGRVSVVDPIIDPVTRTVRMLAVVPNRGGALRPGLSADVSVTLASRDRALTIPDEAVFAEGNANFVYVVKADSSVTKTVVTLGTRDSARVEVIRGLQPGQNVVRAGHQKLYEGAHVMPVGGEAPPAAAAGK